MRIAGCIALAAVVAAGCSSDEVCATGDCTEHVFVSRGITFAQEDDGITAGFDLDERVSADDDIPSCGWEDYVDADGRQGIDNQFALLWGVILDAAGDAVEGLLQGAINDGTLLIGVEMIGVDDLQNDDCVAVDMLILAGQPDIGTDGLITTGQTFDIREDSPEMHVDCGVIEDGIITAGPFDGFIPVQLLAVAFDLKVHGAYIRGTMNDDGTVSFVLGAGVEVQQIIDVANNIPGSEDLAGVITPLMRNRADLARDEFGDCQQLSATMLVDSAPAFIYADAAR